MGFLELFREKSRTEKKNIRKGKTQDKSMKKLQNKNRTNLASEESWENLQMVENNPTKTEGGESRKDTKNQQVNQSDICVDESKNTDLHKEASVDVENDKCNKKLEREDKIEKENKTEKEDKTKKNDKQKDLFNKRTGFLERHSEGIMKSASIFVAISNCTQGVGEARQKPNDISLTQLSTEVSIVEKAEEGMEQSANEALEQMGYTMTKEESKSQNIGKSDLENGIIEAGQVISAVGSGQDEALEPPMNKAEKRKQELEAATWEKNTPKIADDESKDKSISEEQKIISGEVSLGKEDGLDIQKSSQNSDSNTSVDSSGESKGNDNHYSMSY